METIEIPTVDTPLRASIRPPGSKSITNRALVCAALAEGASTLTGALASDDTLAMLDCLARLGIEVGQEDEGRKLRVTGQGGRIPATQAELLVGNSGTTIRFVAAMVALGEGTYRLDGVPRMRERPIGDLVAALNSLGSDVRCDLTDGFPPLTVHARRLSGGRAIVAGNASSQFLSGLLMSVPCATGPVDLRVEGTLVSQPYVQMTLAVQKAFGISVDASNDLRQFRTSGGATYQARTYDIEPDASAASYFWAAAAIAGGEVTVEGLKSSSLQGDVRFVRVLERMGCHVTETSAGTTVVGDRLRGVDVDMNDISDTVQTLAAVALFAEGPTTVRGVAHNRLKETDRISALATELRRLGAAVEEYADGLRIEPRPLHAARLATYDDHRMAMSLALVGLRVPGVTIENPACTAKTYPGYFADLRKVCSASS
jgi:3-phosphoshikimate 1-carboxyvinyltransferase